MQLCRIIKKDAYVSGVARASDQIRFKLTMYSRCKYINRTDAPIFLTSVLTVLGKIEFTASSSRKTTLHVLRRTIQAGKRPIFALASFAAARKSCRRQINNAIVRQVDLYGKEERKNSSKWKKKKHKSLSIHFTQCLVSPKTKHCDICGYHRFWMVVNFSFMLEISPFSPQLPKPQYLV